ncbi:hypothetical protein [Nonomuraea sediminis]|uniref:hypothetical protein n=1 Tax=Nonomuraea sediminis TaxID=2835864 RepID=UPI001BDCB97A|nr:hypothetical protein [Nonomuraea sediminis]
MKIGSYAKAVVAAVSAGMASFVTAAGDGVVNTGEWVTVALAVVGALGITYVVPNSEKSESRQRY